jgi:predicted glycosyltransferase
VTLRVLIAVTHLLGGGHLTRAAAIARAVASRGHDVTLVSGGRPTAIVSLNGVELVQLPPVQAELTDFTTLLTADGRPAGPEYLASRSALLRETVDRTRPDVLVTELFPFGRRSLSGEFTALLDAAEAVAPRPAVACSIRDVLVAPEKPAKIHAAHALVRQRYDAVLVHGDPDLLPLDASWPVDDGLRPLLRYTGYVDAEAGESGGAHDFGSRSAILVSGGSSAAALPLCRAAIAAGRMCPDLDWHILVGRGVPEAAFVALVADAADNTLVERARADFRVLLARSSLFVGLAGYNTVVDLFATGSRAVLVPFEAGHETEQRCRADSLAARGLATVLREDDLDGNALAAAARTSLAGYPPGRLAVACDGAERTATLLEELARGRASATRKSRS